MPYLKGGVVVMPWWVTKGAVTETGSNGKQAAGFKVGAAAVAGLALSLDFLDPRLARDFDQGQTVGMTRVVTPGYAPLEQYRGTGRFGPSTDVYGLAATLYRLATGRVPVAALERDGGAALPSPRDHNPAISREVSDAILDGLELQPGHRPQDLDAFLARLGIRGLPEGPRSMLLDASLPPTSPPPSSARSSPRCPTARRAAPPARAPRASAAKATVPFRARGRGSRRRPSSDRSP